MVLQKREKALLDFIDTFGAATTSQLQRLFYICKDDRSAKVKAQARLKLMYDNKHIKRDRSHLNTEFIYYKRKTQFINHQILLVDVYIRLKNMPGEIIEFIPEVDMVTIRSDAKVQYDDGEYTHIFLVEIHRGTNPFDQQKYEDFYYTKAWSKYFKVYPKILVVSDRKITLKPTKLPFVIVPYSLEGIEKIIGV